MTVALSLFGMPGWAAAWATLGAILLLLIQYVLEPVLADWQRRAFHALTFPLLAVLGVYVFVDFLEAIP